MHITRPHLSDRTRGWLYPAAIACGLALVMPLIGIGLLMFRGMLFGLIAILAAVALAHYCVVRRRTHNGGHFDA